MKRLKLVVSDFHIGQGRYFNDGTRNILEDFHHDDQFVAFLQFYSTGDFKNADVELIINGDFLNLLQMNHKGVHTYLMTERMVVEGVQLIVKSHQDLFQSMKEFAAAPSHKITYVIGNHDQGMLFEGPRVFLNQVLGHEVQYFDHHYEFDGIRVEHGHMHDWPTRFNPKKYFLTKGLPEPVLNLPWGSLFVAEILPKIKMERHYVDKVKPFPRLLAWMIVYDTLFAIKTGIRILSFALDTLFLKRRYRFLDINTTIRNLINDVTIYPKYDREAFKILMGNPDLQALIMGHTHVLRYRQYRQGKEYYNIGTWNEATNLSIGNLGTQLMLTYALIEYPEPIQGVNPETTHDQQSLRPKVKLREWKGFWRHEVDAAV